MSTNLSADSVYWYSAEVRWVDGRVEAARCGSRYISDNRGYVFTDDKTVPGTKKRIPNPYLGMNAFEAAQECWRRNFDARDPNAWGVANYVMVESYNGSLVPVYIRGACHADAGHARTHGNIVLVLTKIKSPARGLKHEQVVRYYDYLINRSPAAYCTPDVNARMVIARGLHTMGAAPAPVTQWMHIAIRQPWEHPGIPAWFGYLVDEGVPEDPALQLAQLFSGHYNVEPRTENLSWSVGHVPFSPETQGLVINPKFEYKGDKALYYAKGYYGVHELCGDGLDLDKFAKKVRKKSVTVKYREWGQEVGKRKASVYTPKAVAKAYKEALA